MKRFFTLSMFLMTIIGHVFSQSIYEDLKDNIYKEVAKDGSGDFTTVQEALDAVPDSNDTWKIIFVRKGVYNEKVVLGHKKTFVVLVGEDADSTIIIYDDYANKVLPGHTFSTYTFRADANDFQAYNITFENPTTQGQGVAFHSNGDRQILYHCRLIGNQDTYFDNFRTRRYIKDCFIEGGVDFIFGFGVTLFDSCQIHSNIGGYVTAASTPQHYEFGYVFKDCRLTAGPGVNSYSLGRPWFDWANTVFYECWMSEEVKPGGWDTWGGREETCFYREYNCYGPGSDTTNRVDFGKQLDPAKADRYTIDTILAASNFPSDLGYDADTAELMHMYRRFEASGYPERALIILNAGRDTFPDYPTDDWSPDYYDTVYNVINEYTLPFLDSSNSKFTVENILFNGEEIAGFEPDTKQYVVEMNEGDTAMPTIQVNGKNLYYQVDNPRSLPGYLKTTVTALDKVNYTEYNIYASQDSAYWNTNFDMMVFNRQDTIWYIPGQYEYDLALTDGETEVRSTRIFTEVYDANSEFTEPESIPGQGALQVTAVNGIDMQEYTINFTIATNIRNTYTAPYNVSVVNPVRNHLIMNLTGSVPAEAQLIIYDINGKVYFSKGLHNLQSGLNEIDIHVNDFDAGMYIFEVRQDHHSVRGKIMVPNL